MLLVVAGIGALIRGASAPDPVDAAPTVALSELPEATSALYQYAADHTDHFVELPCYCGCDRTLDHQNLKDPRLGCCPGAFTMDGPSTVDPGAETSLSFELSMHPGMDGPHDMIIHVPVQHTDGTTETVDLTVTGDFSD